jgi:Immunoglobulin I-set domain
MKHLMKNPAPRLHVLLLMAAALALGSAGIRAATVNVFADPARTWNGYVNIYTNGLVNTTYPPYLAVYLGTGTSFPNQSSIDFSGNVTIAPDIWADQNYPLDTLIWADNSGASSAISKFVNDFYIDSTTLANAGDTVVFTGSLTTNALVAPYSENAVLFIKDFDSGWGYHGMASVNLNTLTNGQPFAVTFPGIYADGDHVQWGLEWAGPPARQFEVAGLGYAIISTNNAAPPPPPKTLNVSIDHNQRWVGYQTASMTVPYFTGYLDIGTADMQGSTSASDVARCAPDLRADTLAHTNTTVWQDDTGLSDAIPGLTVDSTFYVDTGTLAAPGDTVVFSGQLLTNTLADPYNSSMVAFIKDFDSGWGYHGMSTVYLYALTNGEVFSVTRTIAGDGSHVQYGFEWVGPPARTNSAASSYVGNLGYVLVGNKLVSEVAGIVSINPNPADVQLGADVTLTAITTGNNLTYVWSKDGVVLTDGPGVSGATTNALTLTNVQGDREGTYSLTVTDAASNTASKSVHLYVYNPQWLYYDRAFYPFNGYINVWNGANLISSPPASGGAGTHPKASFGFAVAPTTLLRASMNTNNDVITLRPNTYVYDNATNTMDPTYINPDGTPAAYLEQDYYIQNDALVGDKLVFAGYCSSNSLNPAYTATAWVKVSQDWTVEYRYDTNLAAGKPFVLTVPASATTGQNYAQFGFAIWGPDNSSTNVLTQGACEVRVYSPLSATPSGANLNLGFPTVLNHGYTVQYKTNLAGGTWSNLTTNSGTGGPITVPDATSQQQRFYRLRIQ